MRKVMTIAALCVSMVLASSVDAAYVSRGGYTIASHRSGRSYSRSSVRYMTGRGPRLQRYLAGAGHYTAGGAGIIDTYTFGNVSYFGNWAGGPRGYVKTDSRRRNENFVLVYGNSRAYSLVPQIDLR